MRCALKRGMGVTFYWDQKGTSKAISKAAAGLRVPYGASMPVACAAPSLRRSRAGQRSCLCGCACHCDRRSLAPPCPARPAFLLLADWCAVCLQQPACVTRCLMNLTTRWGRVRPSEWWCSSDPSVRRLVPPDAGPLIAIRACAGVRPHCVAIANKLMRAAAAARSGSVRPLIHLIVIDRPLLHYCLLLLGVAGPKKESFGGKNSQGSPCFTYVRAAQANGGARNG